VRRIGHWGSPCDDGRSAWVALRGAESAPWHPPMPRALCSHLLAFFSFFFFCFSLVDSFGLLSFLPFSIPLAIGGPPVAEHDTRKRRDRQSENDARCHL